MILHKCEYQNSPLYTLFDSSNRVIIHATRYFDFLGRTNRPQTSQKIITSVVKNHCDWIEGNARFRGNRVDDVLSIITNDDIINWINYQRRKGISENTIHHREILIRQMYNYFSSSEASVRKDTPWRKRYFTRQQHQKRPQFLTNEQIIILLSGMNYESQRAAAHFMVDTGVRVSELIRLKRKHLPTEAEYQKGNNYFVLRVLGSKAYDGNEYKIHDTVLSRPVLNRVRQYHLTTEYKTARGWKINDPDKPVFLNVYGAELTNNTVYRNIKESWERVGDKQLNVSPHSLRHTTGYSVLRGELGEDMTGKLLLLRDMFGHESIKTTEIYCSIPIAIMESIKNQQEVHIRYLEAQEIYQSTYLPSPKHTAQ